VVRGFWVLPVSLYKSQEVYYCGYASEWSVVGCQLTGVFGKAGKKRGGEKNRTKSCEKKKKEKMIIL
jgi:hypothetical protein